MIKRAAGLFQAGIRQINVAKRMRVFQVDFSKTGGRETRGPDWSNIKEVDEL